VLKKKLMKKYIAEFIGTFALVFFGTGAIIVNQQTEGSLGLLGISLTFGIIISVMIYVFGSISGAHLNPAVTISLAVGKLIPKNEIIAYLLAQVFGSISASSILRLLFIESISLGETQPSGEIFQSFWLELILTFFLMLTILVVTSKKELSNLTGIIIGLMVTAMILFAGSISGGSFNPARSIGPALISGNLTALWVYIIAPISGAVLAMFTLIIFKK